jgi:Zn-dependent protease with chaperone function
VPHALELSSYTPAEIDIILEHEIAHVRMARFWRNEFNIFFCLPGICIARLLRKLRIIALQNGVNFISRAIFRLERFAFLITDRFIGRAEEYAADALASLASGRPDALDRVLERIDSRKAQVTEAEEQEVIRFLVTKTLDWTRKVSEYDKALSYHPSEDDRRGILRSLIRKV